jgi:hypothetical protein
VHEDYSTSVASPIDVDTPLGSGSMYPDTVEKGDGVITVAGSVDQRHIDPEDRDALIAATSFATKAKWLNGRSSSRRDQARAVAGAQRRPVRHRQPRPADQQPPPRRVVQLPGRQQRRRLVHVDARQRDGGLHMSRVAFTDTDLPEDLEVDLWGTVFDLMPITRDRQLELEELTRQFAAIDEDEPDAADNGVAILAQVLDVHLQPAGNRRKKASELVLERWKAQQLRSAQLFDFTLKLADLQRPT